MGQPKFARKKYETPNHPWQGERIKSEHELRRKFGLKNKTEIWKAQSRLRDVRGQARELISRTRNPDDEQAQMEAKRLLKRLNREGLIGQEATLNEVLGLDVERILNRRLQSQVYLKGMARTPKQARQFVSHGLVQIGERRVTVPSYVVRRDEEEQIQFVPDATVADPEHPVRPKAPGADAMAEREGRVPHGTGADSPTESPTLGDAPVKTDAVGTVAPSQGERAENAQREAGPGKQPPAAEAKVQQPQQSAGEAKEAKAPVTQAPKTPAAPPAQATPAEAAEAPAASSPQAEPATQGRPMSSKAPEKGGSEEKAAAKEAAKPAAPAPGADDKDPAEALGQLPVSPDEETSADEPTRPDPTQTDEPKEARATKPKEVSEDPATEPKTETGAADAKEGEA